MFRNGLIIALASLVLVCAAQVGVAQVYKHVDENGNITFTDKPPADAELIEIRSPNSISAPVAIEYHQEAAPKAEVAEGYTVKITAPANETIIARGPGNFSVSASVTPGLQAESRLQLLIDGAARGEPQSGTSWALTNVFRGTHALEIAVVNAKGKQLAKSAPITVYVFRPSSNF
jgi:hypothetical protein